MSPQASGPTDERSAADALKRQVAIFQTPPLLYWLLHIAMGTSGLTILVEAMAWIFLRLIDQAAVAWSESIG